MSIECRSALYMPASNQRALAKGPSLAADVIIIDLEDSVAPDNKALARKQAAHTLQHADFGYRVRALRINAAGTPWHIDDAAVAAQCKPNACLLYTSDAADE